MSELTLTWYGHCAFLIEIAKKSILIDPYDYFNGIEIGEIEADYLVSSSIAHDHGNIAASVDAYAIGHEGEYDIPGGITLNGILATKSQGTPTVIWNIKSGKYSITNFADWGNEDDIKEFTHKEKETLKSTNIAFIRPNEISEQNIQCAELALKVCEPNVIIPHHFYPESFIRMYPTDNMIKMHAQYKPLVNLLISKLDYEVTEVKSHKTKLTTSDLKKKKLLLFKDIHSQVVSIN